PKNLVARFIGVLFSPRETFQSIVPVPKWFGMFALSTVLIAIFTALPMTTPAGKQAALDQQVQQRQSFGIQTDEAAHGPMEKMQGVMPYITAGSVIIFSPIMLMIFGGILIAIFNAALGGEASFKQMLAILTHAGVVSTTSAVISGTVNYFTGRVGSVSTL